MRAGLEKRTESSSIRQTASRFPLSVNPSLSLAVLWFETELQASGEAWRKLSPVTEFEKKSN